METLDMTTPDSTPDEAHDPAGHSTVLVEISSEAGTARFPARGDVVRIGRALDNDIVLDGEQTVSRQHAELLRGADGWSIRDLGSHNGTYVNGEQVNAGADRELDPDDVIGLGNVTMRVLHSAAPGDGADDGMTVRDARGIDMHKLLTALSVREREVLTLVAGGRTDEQVARELFISVKTVHSHLDRIRDKSGLRRRADLTRLAVRLGLSNAPR